MPRLKSAINIAYRIAGRKNYEVDDSLKASEVFAVIFPKRGLFYERIF